MIRDLLRRNPGLKLLSLVLAYILWAWAVGQGPAIRQFEVPVQVDPPAEDVLVVRATPSKVPVRIEGDPTTVRSIGDNDVFVRHALRPSEVHLGDGPREQVITLRPQDIERLPPGVRATLLEPVIRVVLEERLERPVPVEAALTGKPAPGYEIVRTVVTPPRVRVTGPRSVVEQLERLTTAPVPVGGANRTQAFPALAVFPPDAVPREHLSFDPPQVDVRVEIDQVREEFDFEVPVTPTATGWSVRPDTVTVRLKTTPNLADRIADQLRASVITDDLPADGKVRRLPVQVSLGELDPFSRSRVEVLAIDPPRVRVRRQRHP